MVIFNVTNILRRAGSGTHKKLIAWLSLLSTDPSIHSMIGKRIEGVNQYWVEQVYQMEEKLEDRSSII